MEWSVQRDLRRGNWLRCGWLSFFLLGRQIPGLMAAFGSARISAFATSLQKMRPVTPLFVYDAGLPVGIRVFYHPLSLPASSEMASEEAFAAVGDRYLYQLMVTPRHRVLAFLSIQRSDIATAGAILGVLLLLPTESRRPGVFLPNCQPALAGNAGASY